MQRRLFIEQTSWLSTGALIIGSAYKPKSDQELKTSYSDLIEISIENLQDEIVNHNRSIIDITKWYLDRIESIDRSGPTINSVIYLNPKALEDASQLESELRNKGPRGPLHGIPVLLKDNIDTSDMPTTAGSRAMEGSIPPLDSHVVKLLRESGAVILGKANLSEWANFRGEDSSSGWSGLGGLTKNPYVLDRNTCGSSAGSGAAVSANLCMLAIGTETNGSIVCPASTNGIVGIKPTVGLVSRAGIIPISSTQDTAGPMARSVSDAVHCLNILKGIDPRDSATKLIPNSLPIDYTSYLKKDGLNGKRIAHFTSSKGKLESVDTLMAQAISVMEAQGATIIEIDKISEDEVGENSFTVMLYEYKKGLNDYFASLGPKAPIKSLEELIEWNKKDSLELKHFGQEYLEMAQSKDNLESVNYKKHLASLRKLSRKEGLDRIMNEHQLDAVIAPTNSPAWKTDLKNGDTFVLGSSSPAARSGYPNITVPMGMIDRLPVGISIFGRGWSEAILIEIAYAYEQASLHRRSPKFYVT
ncbi:MAG: amidase [Saprospiraceae bacterium]|jgi:amidase